MGGSQVAVEYDFCDLNNDLDKTNNGTNGANGTIPPKEHSTPSFSQPPPPSPPPSSPSTASSNITTPSAAVTSSISSAAPKQRKIDQRQWNMIEWFGCGDYWQDDFAKWIILVLEERENSEDEYIEAGLNIIKKEIEEIFDTGMMGLNSYESCLDLITKSRNIRSNYDKTKRDELLCTIFDHLQINFDKANLVIETLGRMSVGQRSVLRFMAHQKVQARIAFLRTTLKTHKTTLEMERYHCITNPYYDELDKQSQAIVEELQATINTLETSNGDLSQQYSDLNNDYSEVVNINKQVCAINQELNQENTKLKDQLQENAKLKGQLQENTKLKEQIKTINEQLSELYQDYDYTVNLNKELSDENEKILATNQELSQENNKLKEQLQAKNEQLLLQIERVTQKEREESLVEGIYARITQERDKMKSEYEAGIKQLQDETEELRKHAKQLQDEDEELRKHAKQIQDEDEELRKHAKQIQDEDEELRKHAKQLQDEAEELRRHAKQLQDEDEELRRLIKKAALGSATNVRWSDSTLNNPIQLTKDIEKFQHSLTDFTKVKGRRSFKIDEDAAKQLLASYGCKANPNTREIKNYLTAALQRMILETIFNNADKLYNTAKRTEGYSDELLESFIIYHSQRLIKNTNALITNREGQDAVTAITPIKIRQQVYAALGSSGFAKPNHPFIKNLVKEILGKMEDYREVVDEERKKELRSDAENIVRNGLQLWFSLKAQEPMAEICWFKSGDPLETHLMVYTTCESENVKKMEVDFTIFPLIITERDNQILNKAQVFVRPKRNGKFSYIY